MSFTIVKWQVRNPRTGEVVEGMDRTIPADQLPSGEYQVRAVGLDGEWSPWATADEWSRRARRARRRWRARVRLHTCPFCQGNSWLKGSRLVWVWLLAALVALTCVNGLLDSLVWLVER